MAHLQCCGEHQSGKSDIEFLGASPKLIAGLQDLLIRNNLLWIYITQNPIYLAEFEFQLLSFFPHLFHLKLTFRFLPRHFA